MLLKTSGIFLQKINYSETSLIVKIYTREAGLQSYLLKGARGKKSKIKANVLQHLTLLDLEVYHRDSANLQRVKELRIAKPFKTLPYDIRKSTIVLFINELLVKVLREEQASAELFDFIYQSISLLDDKEEKIKSFHLIFMLQLSKYLGFNPQGAFSESRPFFDMMEGVFTPKQPEHAYFVEGELARVLSQAKDLSVECFESFNSVLPQQNELLDKLVDYYRLHIPEMGEMKSVAVLRAILA